MATDSTARTNGGNDSAGIETKSAPPSRSNPGCRSGLAMVRPLILIDRRKKLYIKYKV